MLPSNTLNCADKDENTTEESSVQDRLTPVNTNNTLEDNVSLSTFGVNTIKIDPTVLTSARYDVDQNSKSKDSTVTDNSQDTNSAANISSDDTSKSETSNLTFDSLVNVDPVGENFDVN